ncbi:hypothetical protein PInf_008171 [Phytophthora infestans]|nr:hypothetical protein PInf_008171 [Phytophthora infestans]
MQNDERIQLFKHIPKRQADWPVLAQELQFPVNSVSTSQVAEASVSLLLSLGFDNETYPSRGRLRLFTFTSSARFETLERVIHGPIETLVHPVTGR